MQTIVLGGGCFWCLEAVFNQLKGVEEVVSGYAGGSVVNPSYSAVCAGTTGHAEVIKISFNPDDISLKELLQIFFTIHDPTTVNQQGADVGTQYRSVIFCNDEAQMEIAEAVIEEFSQQKVWPNPIVTKVELLETFYPAEAYHQRYYEQHPEEGYCQIVIEPKVAKLRKEFQQKLRAA